MSGGRRLRFAESQPRVIGRSKPEPSFLMSRGGEVDGDVGRRNVIAAIFQRGAIGVAALADGGVGQTGGVEVV
jgi:hypothetical protein